MEIECSKCGHKWESKSKLCQVRCASCGRLNYIREKILKDGDKE